jgi:hypothetical protein
VEDVLVLDSLAEVGKKGVAGFRRGESLIARVSFRVARPLADFGVLTSERRADCPFSVFLLDDLLTLSSDSDRVRLCDDK